MGPKRNHSLTKLYMPPCMGDTIALDIAYLYRLAREEPFNYVYFALQFVGLQGYVEAINVFN